MQNVINYSVHPIPHGNFYTVSHALYGYLQVKFQNKSPHSFSNPFLNGEHDGMEYDLLRTLQKGRVLAIKRLLKFSIRKY